MEFWQRVAMEADDECWDFTGPRNFQGYGMHAGQGAHRFAWISANGPIPDGKIICHTCDRPCCVNPRHLYAGSYSDNARDHIARGRVPAWLAAKRATASRLHARAVSVLRSSGKQMRTDRLRIAVNDPGWCVAWGSVRKLLMSDSQVIVTKGRRYMFAIASEVSP